MSVGMYRVRYIHASHGPIYGIVWTDTTYTYSGTGTLVNRSAPYLYEGTEQDSVDAREGRVAIHQLSIQTWPLKEARRGSWIWPVLGGDLNRAARL